MNRPGRFCPAGYGYGAASLREQNAQRCETLYVVGGLYGNEQALDAVERLADTEGGSVTLMFNGDFNWFNVDAASFQRINRRALAHGAILGNVEYELAMGDGQAGCGCTYPQSVDEATVARSNAIHASLTRTASGFAPIRDALRQLPMHRTFRVGDLTLGVVHGDADSLAGWRFAHDSLDDPLTLPWLEQVFRAGEVDGFASRHTCLPVCRSFNCAGRNRFVINNGAAGMPSFAATRYGVITRIGLCPSPHRPLYGLHVRGVYIDALGVECDYTRWSNAFLANWPVGSPAWASYWQRLETGPQYSMAQAAPASNTLGLAHAAR